MSKINSLTSCMMELVINNFEDLHKELPAEIERVKIDIPNLGSKDIVNLVLKYESFGEVWVKTKKFPHFLKDGYLVFGNHRKIGYPLKRKLDLFIGVLGLICSLPVLLASSMLIKLSSKGPVIFCQSRVNALGKRFNFYKFRTMKTTEETEIHYNYIKKSIKEQNCNQKVYKLTNDYRVTPIGKWLRRLSIDELPQLINVLKGEMALVGPRPPIPYEVELYKDWHKARLRAKPGITGLWQATGRSLIPFDEMVVLDLYYVANESLWLDLKILFHTIPMTLSLKGAY